MSHTKLIEIEPAFRTPTSRDSARPCSRRWAHSRLVLALSVILAAGAFGSARSVAQTSTGAPAGTWTAPPRAARKPNPVPADTKSLAQGKELFVAACLPCHGASGRGDGPVSATLERNGVRVHPGNLTDPKMWQQSDGAIFWKVSEGNSPMPSFQESYSEEQRWHIVNYVRTLAPPQQVTNSNAQQNK
jgi:mono/diheme cytochrome c family protein